MLYTEHFTGAAAGCHPLTRIFDPHCVQGTTELSACISWISVSTRDFARFSLFSWEIIQLVTPLTGC